MPDADPPTDTRELTPVTRDRLVRLAFRFVRNRFDAEDVVHNAVTLAHEKREQLHDAGRWWSWMCRIVVRQCISLVRSESRREGRERERAESSPAGADAAHDIDAVDRAAVLRRAIDVLPPQQRAAIILRHLEGMDYDGIAEVLDVSPATARVHVRDARESLRARITGRYPEWAPVNTGPGE